MKSGPFETVPDRLGAMVKPGVGQLNSDGQHLRADTILGLRRLMA